LKNEFIEKLDKNNKAFFIIFMDHLFVRAGYFAVFHKILTE